MFNVELEVDYDDFACKMVDEIEEEDREITVEILDKLPLSGIIKVIELAREYTDEGTEEILDSLAEGYIRTSKRPFNEKKILTKRITGESLE